LNPCSDSCLNLRAPSTNQLVISSQELHKASAEIERLNLYKTQLEEQLASKSAQLEQAQAHVTRHDLALKVVEREMAEAQRAKGKADRKLGDAEALREQLQVSGK
jgi:chromosome segregation ATPase